MGEDLSGGYWEAGGSYLKVAFPQAFVITQLAWAATAFPSGFTATGLRTLAALVRIFQADHDGWHLHKCPKVTQAAQAQAGDPAKPVPCK